MNVRWSAVVIFLFQSNHGTFILRHLKSLGSTYTFDSAAIDGMFGLFTLVLKSLFNRMTEKRLGWAVFGLYGIIWLGTAVERHTCKQV